MRDFLNAILNAIAETNLTDPEFATVTAEAAILDENTYNDLSNILDSRGGVNSSKDRLSAYYKAHGNFDFAVKPNASEIYLGSGL